MSYENELRFKFFLVKLLHHGTSCKTYPTAALEEAVRRIKAGEISQKKAAKEHDILVMTLLDHVNGRVSGTKPGLRAAHE
ncbi:hypothetical protein ElyMa_006973000 [Elysia marginata]|uniref:HTH psq-type domain-containing protein n=1 Tax=Elysia marginata TaxID=1093978 RepID=A0AAV4JQQ2_9GAST|nr:hypothetical protein ElyMa_006973000 [Elysia marginata]